MGMVAIYAPGAVDFSNNGLGLLLPTECTVKEQANGMYELTLVHPITDDLRWTQIQNGCIIKASVPMRESPLYEIEAFEGVETSTTKVTRKLYKVDVNTRLRLRAKPNTSSKILGRYKNGTQVIRLKDMGNGWYKVSVKKGGATGYMYASYLDYVKDITETVTTTKPVTRDGVTVSPSREQLFRISSVEVNTEQHTVTATAMHIFYDLRGNPLGKAYSPTNADANTAAQIVFDGALMAHDFELSSHLTGTVTGEYGFKGITECLLDPDEGILAQTGGVLVRDNYDVFLLPAETRDMGVTIRRGKNLIGVQVTTDNADVVTRIIPVGRNSKGDDLFLDGTIYVDSPYIGQYPNIYAKRIDYDVTVGDGDGEYSSNAKAREELRKRAQADFDSGVDMPAYGMEVDFITLQDTAEYAEYASLQAVNIHDTVTVIDELINLRAKLRVTGYEWDALAEKYDSVTLGELVALEQVTYGYTLAANSVSGSKIIPGSVGGTALRSASIQYAKIAQAAIDQLAANAITAVRAHINELVAGSVTTDELYAALATIAALEVANAQIDYAQIKDLTAEVARIASAQITTANIQSANIDWAQITTLNAAIASIAQAKIEDAEITSAQIIDLEAVVAKIANASIGTADIGFAQIKDLITQQAIITEGVGGQLYIARLAVTEANMVSLTVGELVVKGSDGHFYSVSVDENGKVVTTLKQVVNDDIADMTIHGTQKLIEGSITAQVLNAQNIFGDSAIIRELIAANLDVDTLFAREATIKALNAVDIRGNEYLQLSVEGKSTIYRGERPPAGGKVNDLFIQNDTGYTFQRIDAGDALPEFYMDETGILYYRYQDGQAEYKLYMDANGDLQIEDNPYLTIAIRADGTPEWWTRVKDSQLEKEAQDAINAAKNAQATADQNTATIVEHDSAIALNKANIELRVTTDTFNQTVDGIREDISNTESKIDVRADEIISSVSTTYATKKELGTTNSNITSLTTRVQSAEQKITADAIVSTVRNSTAYTSDLAGKASVNSVNTAQSTANANATNITSLTTRVQSAESSITQNANNIALKVSTSTYNAEKVYRASSAPSSPSAGMLWLDTAVNPNLLKRYTGSVWVVVGAQEIKASGINIGSNNVVITTENFLLQLLDPADNENVLMEMSADGNVGFKQLYADEVVSDSVVQTYMGAATLYVDPTYTGDSGAYFRSLSDAMEEVNYRYLRSDVQIYLPSSGQLYETEGVSIKGIFGPGTLRIYGRSCSLNGYIAIEGCCSKINIQNLYVRESRSAATNLIAVSCSQDAEFDNCTFDGNSVSSRCVNSEVSDIRIYACEFYNAKIGLRTFRGAAQVDTCKGSCSDYALYANASTIYANGTIPGDSIATHANGQIHSSGITVDYGSSAPTALPDATATFTASATRSWRGSWRTDTQDVIQGVYSGSGYSSGLSWHRGCMWFSTLTGTLSGHTVKSAKLTLRRKTGSGASSAKTVYLCAISQTSASGTPSIQKNFGALGTIGRGKQVTFSIPVAAVQGLADGTYGGLCLYETPYNFGSSTYSSSYMRINGADSDYAPKLDVVYN